MQLLTSEFGTSGLLHMVKFGMALRTSPLYRLSVNLEKNATWNLAERSDRRIDELKQRLIDVQNDLEQDVINDSLDDWHKRLRACVRALNIHECFIDSFANFESGLVLLC